MRLYTYAGLWALAVPLTVVLIHLIQFGPDHIPQLVKQALAGPDLGVLLPVVVAVVVFTAGVSLVAVVTPLPMSNPRSHLAGEETEFEG